MRRKKKDETRVSHERWLVSYADFITLMFAFFVVMFASAQVDRHKAIKLSAAIEDAFQEMGVFQAASSRLPLTDLVPAENVQITENGKGVAGQSQRLFPPEKLAALQKQLTQALAPELQRHEVALNAGRDGLIISLREIGFFDSGSAQLRPTSEATVRRIAGVLSAQTNNIRIEGHTDNVPIHNAQFASNWELSTARATEMIRLFIMRYNLPATRLSAAGYAEYHPVAGNETVEGRAQNRRVDIVVLASAPERLEGSKQ
jgi:chemotaxis protein MotB